MQTKQLETMVFCHKCRKAENNAFFKGEGTQTNFGLGKGKALEIFNSNIINFKRTGGK